MPIRPIVGSAVFFCSSVNVLKVSAAALTAHSVQDAWSCAVPSCPDVRSLRLAPHGRRGRPSPHNTAPFSERSLGKRRRRRSIAAAARRLSSTQPSHRRAAPPTCSLMWHIIMWPIMPRPCCVPSCRHVPFRRKLGPVLHATVMMHHSGTRTLLRLGNAQRANKEKCRRDRDMIASEFCAYIIILTSPVMSTSTPQQTREHIGRIGRAGLMVWTAPPTTASRCQAGAPAKEGGRP